EHWHRRSCYSRYRDCAPKHHLFVGGIEAVDNGYQKAGRMSIRTTSRPSPRATWHHGPSWLWLLSFVICMAGDALLGRWVLLPIYVAGFYGGMIVIDLLTYPMLERWRAWLRPRGVWAWYVVEVGLMWIGTAIVLALLGLLGPRWLGWSWQGMAWLQALGAG